MIKAGRERGYIKVIVEKSSKISSQVIYCIYYGSKQGSFFFDEINDGTNTYTVCMLLQECLQKTL